MILGCDISTSISGYTVIDDDGKVVLNESLNTKRIKDLNEVVSKNLEKVKEIFNKHDIDDVFVEENLKSFGRGKSSASTLIKLAKLNGIFCFMIKESHGIEAKTILPTTARKKYGLTVNNKKRKAKRKQLIEERGMAKSSAKSRATKEIVLDYIEEIGEDFTYEMTYAGNPKPEAYDRADSLVIARAGEKIVNSS